MGNFDIWDALAMTAGQHPRVKTTLADVFFSPLGLLTLPLLGVLAGIVLCK